VSAPEYQDVDVDTRTIGLGLFCGLIEQRGGHYQLTAKGDAWMNTWIRRQMPRALIAQGWHLRDLPTVRLMLKGLVATARMMDKDGEEKEKKMYDIMTYAYGVPYTEEIAKALGATQDEGDEDPADVTYDPLEDHGFEFYYSGSADFPPGFMGEGLWEGPSWEVKVTQLAQLQPTDEQRAKVDEQYEKFPDWLKEVAPKPAMIEVWSTS